MVLACAGCWSPLSWKRSALSTLTITQLFTADAAKQRLERVSHAPNQSITYA